MLNLTKHKKHTVLIKMKPKFQAWLSNVSKQDSLADQKEFDSVDLDILQADGTVYIIPENKNLLDSNDLMLDHLNDIAAIEVARWCPDEKHWPKEAFTLETFHDWFSAEIVPTGVYTLTEAPLPSGESS